MTNAILTLLDQRVSLRKYADKPVTKEELDSILHGAMRAPTAGNMMLYSMIVVEDQGKKQVLSETCDHQPFIASAPVVLVFLTDAQRWHDYYKASDVAEYCRRMDLEFYKPHLGDFLLGANDAIIAAQNAVIAAESLGIGSCYIGDIMEHYETHRELFELPDYCFPVAMLCLGHYPDDMVRQPKERLPKESVIFVDKYKQLDTSALKAAFAQREAALPKPNGLKAANFGQFMYGRKTGAPFFQEMHRSIAAALDHWQGGVVDEIKE